MKTVTVALAHNAAGQTMGSVNQWVRFTLINIRNRKTIVIWIKPYFTLLYSITLEFIFLKTIPVMANVFPKPTHYDSNMD